MKTVMKTIEIVMKLGDEYKEKYKRSKGVSDYISDHLGTDEKITKKYILVLLRYARFLRKENLWDIAKEEDWEAERIREKIRMLKMRRKEEISKRLQIK